MLVLARKKNEWIEIGDDIKICVVGIYGDQVRIGIEAPAKTPVNRSEVAELIRQNGGKITKRPRPA